MQIKIHADHTFLTRLVVNIITDYLHFCEIKQKASSGVTRVQMIMNETPKEYRAYLLRIWPVRKMEGVMWHAFIANAHTNESRGFANLDELFDYLRKQTCQESESNKRKP